MQEEKPGEQERVVAKSKPTREFSFKDCRSPLALGSRASYSQGTLKAQSSNKDLTSTVEPAARDLIENTASSSQVWHPQCVETRGGKDKETHANTIISPPLDMQEQCWPS